MVNHHNSSSSTSSSSNGGHNKKAKAPIYYVERIEESRVSPVNGKTEYLIKWEGFPK